MSDSKEEHPIAEATEDNLEVLQLFSDDTKRSLNEGFLSYFLPEVTRLRESFQELT